jgi:hypothetical protein
LRYARETRNAVTFIAVVVGIVAALSLIGVIIVGVQLAHLNSELNNAINGTSVNTDCASLGGNDPTC